ncbi:MAG: hypothetical protein QNJ31_09370 [Candidatus Caenarcaniphilales bacterium]|nr:hypothetical protein [Candidatus Caenarcaniphilales bacterium]
MPNLQIILKNGFLLSNFLLAVCFFFFDEPLHHKRDLKLWERISHPIDTVFTCFTYSIALWATTKNSQVLFWLYCISALFTIVLSYKDEFIHKQECCVRENIIHAAMFSLSGISFTLGACLILIGNLSWPFLLAIVFASFTLCWQIVFWFFLRDKLWKK